MPLGEELENLWNYPFQGKYVERGGTILKDNGQRPVTTDHHEHFVPR